MTEVKLHFSHGGQCGYIDKSLKPEEGSDLKE